MTGSLSQWWVSVVGRVVRHGRQDVVETAVALLGLSPVALDPRGHEVEDLGLQVHRTPLGVAAAADQAGVLEHPQVLGDGLDADVVGLGELADGGVGDRQPGDHVAPRGVGQGREDPGERIGGHRVSSLPQPNG
jgi:hypothetical protein